MGKTALSIQLAEYFNTEIISVDSRQCYKELNIGVAKPSIHQLNTVPHHFISSHSIQEEVNAGLFEQYALTAVSSIFEKNKVAIMVGGTGLYIKAFAEGIDNMPSVPSEIRQGIIEEYNKNGLKWLQQQLAEKDPLFWQTAEQQNPQRLMRALEILIATGQSINTFKTKKPVTRPFNIIKIALELPREKLVKNINQRVDAMIEEGQKEEVLSLMPYQELNALQTVGYKELFDYYKGKCSLEQAIEQIKINTRQYAKRQMTWLKKDKDFKWLVNHEGVLAELIASC